MERSPEAIGTEAKSEKRKPAQRTKATTSKSKRQPKENLKWIDADLEDNSEDFSQKPTLPLTSENHPLDFFLLFIDEDLVKIMVGYMVSFAARCNESLELSIEEMYCFIGILFLSGYAPLPRRKMYWEDSDDVRSVLVSKSMRRDRFFKIFKYLHFCSDDLDSTDKFTKIRPLIIALNERFIKYTPVQKNMSIDESMIPYFGRHGCKQFIRNKPVRFGFKAWVLALVSGYCVSFTLYQGKGDYSTEGLSLGESVVMFFWKILSSAFPLLNFCLFSDNFFTSPKLIGLLAKKGYQLTGTVRANRTGNCPLLPVEKMKKGKRGEFSQKFNKKNGILACRWKDNNVVTVMSNQFGVNPLKKTERYSRAERKRVLVDQPYLVAQYNKYMGGVDLLDNHVANYRINFRGKKWYVPIFMWMMDVAMSNAWVLSKEFGLKNDQLSFRRSVVQALLMKYGSLATHPGPQSKAGSKKVPTPARQGPGHLIELTQGRKRCILCKNKTTKRCVICGPLHDKCFIPFHYV